jgi:hypothetical protein
LKGPHHLWERSAVFREDDTQAGAHDANPEDFGFEGFGFPFFCDFTEKIVAGLACFGERFVAAVAVVAGGRGGDEHARTLGHFGERGD